MEVIGNRYKLEQSLKQIDKGLLYRGRDLALKRDVLIYTLQELEQAAHQEIFRWMGKAPRLSSGQFMHILDVGSVNGTLFAVLQHRTGGPLSEQLNDIEISSRQMLEYVHKLANCIHESRRQQLLQYAVDADNLWIDESGTLRVINYWTEGRKGHTGTPGLALLLYQLGSRTSIPTSSMSAYSYDLDLAFADLPDDVRNRAVDLACSAYEGQCNLSEFMLEVEALLDFDSESTADLRSQEREISPRTPMEYAVDSSAQTMNMDRKPNSRSRRIWFSASGFIVLLLVCWIVLHPHSGHSAKPKASMPVSTSDTVSHPASSKSDTSTSDHPNHTDPAEAKSTPNSSDSAAATSDQPQSGSTPSSHEVSLQTKIGVVPNLINHTRGDAEKMCLASRLHYKYFLVPDAAPIGLVFKQNITPGTKFKQGTRITFWVSKGK